MWTDNDDVVRAVYLSIISFVFVSSEDGGERMKEDSSVSYLFVSIFLFIFGIGTSAISTSTRRDETTERERSNGSIRKQGLCLMERPMNRYESIACRWWRTDDNPSERIHGSINHG